VDNKSGIQWLDVKEENVKYNGSEKSSMELPLPKFTCLVERGLKEGRSAEVWDIVSRFVHHYICVDKNVLKLCNISFLYIYIKTIIHLFFLII